MLSSFVVLKMALLDLKHNKFASKKFRSIFAVWVEIRWKHFMLGACSIQSQIRHGHGEQQCLQFPSD